MKWLKRLLCVGALLVGLVAGPLIMNQGYYFLPDLPDDIKIAWIKNPVKPIKNYKTGVTTDVHYITERITHWQLNGEVVADWVDDRVFPFAYFHDIFANNYKVAYLPLKKQATARVLFLAHDEGEARMILTMLYAKIKGIQMQIERTEEQMIHNISLAYAAENDILSLRNPSFRFKCDVTLSKIEEKDDGTWEQSFYAMKFLNPGDSYEVSMEPGDYFWQLECWNMSNQPVGRWYGEMHFPTPDIDDEIVVRDGDSKAL
jgi:hypothetical protein